MLIVEDQPHAGALVNPQYVGGGKADVVVLQHQPALHVFWALLPPLDPARAAGLMVVVHAADMGDHHRLVVQLHPVEHLRLARQVPDALLGQFRIGRIQQHILRRVERQADVIVAHLLPERAQLRIALRHHVVELRHVRMRRIRRDVGRQPVHVEILALQILEHVVEEFERAFEVRVLLPAARVAGFQPGLAHHLYRKSQAKRAAVVGHAGTCA